MKHPNEVSNESVSLFCC